MCLFLTKKYRSKLFFLLSIFVCCFSSPNVTTALDLTGSLVLARLTCDRAIPDWNTFAESIISEAEAIRYTQAGAKRAAMQAAIKQCNEDVSIEQKIRNMNDNIACVEQGEYYLMGVSDFWCVSDPSIGFLNIIGCQWDQDTSSSGDGDCRVVATKCEEKTILSLPTTAGLYDTELEDVDPIGIKHWSCTAMAKGATFSQVTCGIKLEIGSSAESSCGSTTSDSEPLL